MTPEGIREKFDLYRKWLKTLLIKEFMNLPLKYQENFLVLINKFVEDCKKIMEESKKIHEKIVKIELIKIELLNDTNILWFKIVSTGETIKIAHPISELKNLSVGQKTYHTLFSLGKDIWYSSKEELIQKGR